MSSGDLGIPDVPDENGVLPRPGREQVWVVGNKFDALDASTVAPKSQDFKKIRKPRVVGLSRVWTMHCYIYKKF